MRALIISDIHANLPALEAVLAAAPQHDVVWNLGDIVGYGADPDAAVAVARSLGGVVIRGNHDRACSGDSGGSFDFNDDAQWAIDWTRRVLSEENDKWLSRLPRGPLRPLGNKVACVHGSTWDEDEYLFSRNGARLAFRRSHVQIIFCGHTHWQTAWSSNRRRELNQVKPEFRHDDSANQFELQLCETDRYVLNPGSVGQPRDGDWRAAFAIYDDDRSLLTWCRVPYDVATAQSRIREAGLPEGLASRLEEGS